LVDVSMSVCTENGKS